MSIEVRSTNYLKKLQGKNHILQKVQDAEAGGVHAFIDEYNFNTKYQLLFAHFLFNS